MNRSLLILLVCISSLFADSIGYISAEYPEYGNKTYVSEDTDMFFEEIVEMSYYICGDAGVTIASKLRLTQGKVNFQDTKYTLKNKEYILRPSERNLFAIADFYTQFDSKGRDFLKSVTDYNGLDALFYARFKKSTLNSVLKKMEKNPKAKNSTLVFLAQLYLPQSGATSLKRVKIKVEDLATEPTYDLDLMQASITKSYLEMFEKALKLVQMSGGIQRDPVVETPAAAATTETAAPAASTADTTQQAASQEPLYDDNW